MKTREEREGGRPEKRGREEGNQIREKPGMRGRKTRGVGGERKKQGGRENTRKKWEVGTPGKKT